MSQTVSMPIRPLALPLPLLQLGAAATACAEVAAVTEVDADVEDTVVVESASPAVIPMYRENFTFELVHYCIRYNHVGYKDGANLARRALSDRSERTVKMYGMAP